MKELSLNILDIAENSVKAKATLVEILLTEDEEKLTIIINKIMLILCFSAMCST